MLSSLQNISGLFPGLFHRGESAAAAEEAARGQAQRSQLPAARTDQSRPHHNNLGRDKLSLSPEAQALEAADTDDTESVGDAAAEKDSQSLLGQAGGFVRHALETIRQDLSKALKSFGFDNDAIQNFSQAFVDPVLQALKDGVNFTAELSFAALSQVTVVSGNNVSQSTSLVAQSLEIEVNQDTGEVSVSVAKISFDQQIQTTGGNGQVPLLVIDPDDLASPQELAAKILQGGTSPLAEPAESTEEVAATADAAAEEGASEAAAEGEDAAESLEQTLAAVREKLAENAAILQTRLTIYSVSTYRNDKGETITKLLLDAQLKIASLQNDATAQEEAQSLDLTA